jgi:hypothetical protein
VPAFLVSQRNAKKRGLFFVQTWRSQLPSASFPNRRAKEIHAGDPVMVKFSLRGVFFEHRRFGAELAFVQPRMRVGKQTLHGATKKAIETIPGKRRQLRR